MLIAIWLWSEKFSPGLRYMTWLIVLVGLIIPMRPLFGEGLITVSIPYQTLAFEPTQADNLDRFTSITPIENSSRPLSPILIIAISWATAAALIFLIHMIKHARFLRIVKRFGKDVVDEKILGIYDAIKQQKGIKSNIKLKQCAFITTSMLVGFFRPTILLPDKKYDNYELELIFRHELIHYKRGDLYVKLLSIIASSLHWFNPAVYLMSYAMQADCEASCDEKVLLEAGKENNQFYAELIMDMISGKKSKATQLSTCFYGDKRGIKIRMEAIMSETPGAAKISISALFVLFLTLTVLSGSVFAFSASSPTPSNAFYLYDESLGLQISALQAREIALNEVGGGVFAGLFYDHILDVYRIEILYRDNRYYLAVDANDGAVIIYRREEVMTQTINWTQAIEIALSTMDNGQIIFGGMEIIDGFQIFMFRIESNGIEHEIIIGPYGEVLMNE